MYYDNHYQNIALSSITPSTTCTDNNATFQFFARYLLQKALSVFRWTVPETWDADYLQYVLFSEGRVAVVDVPEYGVIPQQAQIGGLNIFYEPAFALVTNPLIDSLRGQELTIYRGDPQRAECAIIKLTPEYTGIGDMIAYYAGQMAVTSAGIETNLINSKLSYVFAAENKRIATTFKKMFQDILSGEPAVFIDKTLFDADGSPRWATFTQNLQQNYIAGDMIADLRKIEAEFDTRIGIPNANTDKRERLISDEVNANNQETLCLSDLWLEHLQHGIEDAKAMFPGKLDNLSVERRYSNVSAQMGDTEQSYAVDRGDV